MEMKWYPRYGKLRHIDYIWVCIYVVWCLSIPFLLYLLFSPKNKIIGAIASILPMLLLLSTESMLLEWFCIQDNKIVVKTIFSRKEYIIPKELFIIVSYAGVNKGWSLHNARLKRLISISIFDGTEAAAITQTFHEVYLQKKPGDYYNIGTRRKRGLYSNIEIEEDVGPWCIYSFICTVDYMQSFIADHPCTVLVPESLVKSIELSVPQDAQVILDYGY